MDKKAKLNKKISELANEYYLQRGKASGHEKEDWLRAEKEITRKEELKEVIIFMGFIQIMLCLFFGSNSLNIILDLGIFLMIDCFILAVALAIRNILKKRYCLLIILGVLIPLLLANSKKIFNIVTFVVPSEVIELKYDLKSDYFIKKNLLEFAKQGKKYYLLKTNDHYRIIVPHKILEMITFYTSYDRDGQNMGRNLGSMILTSRLMVTI